MPCPGMGAFFHLCLRLSVAVFPSPSFSLLIYLNFFHLASFFILYYWWFVRLAYVIQFMRLPLLILHHYS